MKFKISKIEWVGLGIGLGIAIISLLFITSRFFYLIFGMGILIGLTPFVVSVIHDSKVQAEKEDLFLEFSRNLVESVKTGTPISKSIVNVRDKNYGVLTPNITKLANQISMGIPLGKALDTLASDVNNETISRALTLIGQAEKSGGEIGGILESVTEAVNTTDRLKKERKAAISSLVVEGYIIFIVFIVIVLVLQFQILPLLGNLTGTGSGSAGAASASALSVIGFGGSGGGAPISQQALASAFLYLLLIQGLFSGLTIGKLADGSMKAGIKHSFILMVMAFLVSTGASAFFG